MHWNNRALHDERSFTFDVRVDWSEWLFGFSFFRDGVFIYAGPVRIFLSIK